MGENDERRRLCNNVTGGDGEGGGGNV